MLRGAEPKDETKKALSRRPSHPFMSARRPSRTFSNIRSFSAAHLCTSRMSVSAMLLRFGSFFSATSQPPSTRTATSFKKNSRQLPLVILEGGSPRLFPASHSYSRTPNGPPLCHSRSALSRPFAHLNDTLSKVRVLDH